jgi:ketosteroid isomerase-like protein
LRSALIAARVVAAVFVIVIALAVGCQRSGETASMGSHEADLNSLRDAEIAEEQAFLSKDAVRWLTFFADDATLLYPNIPPIVGKDSISGYAKAVFADPALTVQYQIARADVAQSSDLGYTQGTVTSTTTDPKSGKVVTDRGKWLTIRKKQADGTWKIVQDAWNSDLPLTIASK